MSIKQLLATTLVTITLCAASWVAAFWITDDRLDCRQEFMRSEHGNLFQNVKINNLKKE